ncbi:mitochondral 37S ribosomal protein S27 [Puttea exsequens]|nr:mitochondral 37S ribosomal protein S27 [Puttea exsequens]
MSVPRARLLDLMKVQCRIFSQTFNPEGLRTGNRVLRQRLRGPNIAQYYPRRLATVKDLRKAFKHFPEEMDTWDEEEEERLDHIALAKQRGKGAPKKKRTADESKKNKGKKRLAAAPTVALKP